MLDKILNISIWSLLSVAVIAALYAMMMVVVLLSTDCKQYGYDQPVGPSPFHVRCRKFTEHGTIVTPLSELE